jgi:hypothetical protein
MATNDSINFASFFQALLQVLSEREQMVLKKRYQLTTDVVEPQTLKKIGDAYGITRERVRQIEREATNKLITASRQEPFRTQLEQIARLVSEFLERKGGVVTEEDLIAQHIIVNHTFDVFHLNAFLFVLEQLVADVTRVPESDTVYGYWRLQAAKYEVIEQFVDKVVAALEARGSAIPEAELHALIEEKVVADVEKEYLQAFMAKHPDVPMGDFNLAFLAITKKVEKNILDQWGLSSWAEVKPKKLADKIRLVFHHSKQPLHFRDVAERINDAGFDHKSICAATVHNELIANTSYVLIGRGIYALQDWGYTAGTVADVITSILKEQKTPATKEQIYEAVLKQRKVNPSTIYLALINKQRFHKQDDGTYTVAA